MSTSDLSTLLQEDVIATMNQTVVPLSEVEPPEQPLESILQGTLPWEVTTNPKIMIVDDEPVVLKVVQKHLASEGYKNFITTSEPTRAVEIIHSEQPDVLLLDIMMPKVSGLQILAKVRAENQFIDLPIIILTAAADQETKLKALQLGATDFLGKPVDFVELVARVRNTLAAKAHHDHLKRYTWGLELELPIQATELAGSRLEVIHCLARAVEDYHTETGKHVVRVGRCCGIIALQLGLNEGTVTTIEHAAPLHDIGKIGIPRLTPFESYTLASAEFDVLRQNDSDDQEAFGSIPEEQRAAIRSHTEIGARILGRGISPLLTVASRIALTHHEKWDGSGYPLGLAGEDIPIEGRIAGVADVFDFLSSKIILNPPLPLQECIAIMEAGRGNRFDPAVLDAFLRRQHEIVNVQVEYTDVG